MILQNVLIGLGLLVLIVAIIFLVKKNKKKNPQMIFIPYGK